MVDQLTETVWLEHRTGDRGVPGSNFLVEPLRNFGNSVYTGRSLCQSVFFGGDTKSLRTLLSRVYATVGGS